MQVQLGAGADGELAILEDEVGRCPPDDAEALPRRPPLRLANRPARAREAPDPPVRGLPHAPDPTVASSTELAPMPTALTRRLACVSRPPSLPTVCDGGAHTAGGFT